MLYDAGRYPYYLNMLKLHQELHWHGRNFLDRHHWFAKSPCLVRLRFRAGMSASYQANQACPRHWGVQSSICSWSAPASVDSEGKKREGAQIDLVIDRRDQTINLCEMKFSMKPFEITPSYLEHIIYRRELFRETTGTSKALHLTFVTTYGVAKMPNTAWYRARLRWMTYLSNKRYTSNEGHRNIQTSNNRRI